MGGRSSGEERESLRPESGRGAGAHEEQGEKRKQSEAGDSTHRGRQGRGRDEEAELWKRGSSAGRRAFMRDVIEGLGAERKWLSCKYLYDARGAELFEEICELEEYYPTRAEIEIMRRHARAMASRLGPRAALIEPGSGAGVKTRLLLEALEEPAAYVPIDISGEQLERTALQLSREFPQLSVWPVHADFAADVKLPEIDGKRRVVYFPGSTIGNFEPEAAAKFLRHLGEMAGEGGALLIGVDLKNDRAVLEAAYNDGRGVTAEFNRNLLRRINRELGGDFEPRGFAHRAVYDAARGRVEMRLVSRGNQRAKVGGREFAFSAGEWILTESCYKFAPAEFEALLLRGGWQARERWVDQEGRFAVFFAER